MPAPQDVFNELKQSLQVFKDFLSENTDKLKPAMQVLGQAIPGLRDLVSQLTQLMKQLKTEVNKLFDSLEGELGEHVETAAGFTRAITTLLTTAKSLLPSQAGTIDSVLSAASVANSLPSVGQIKDEINALLDSIIENLEQLNS